MEKLNTFFYRSKELCDAMGVECVVIDQTENHATLVEKVDEQVKITGNSFSTGQLRSYMRTPVSYYAAQLLSQEGNPAIVMGTGNQVNVNRTIGVECSLKCTIV